MQLSDEFIARLGRQIWKRSVSCINRDGWAFSAAQPGSPLQINEALQTPNDTIW